MDSQEPWELRGFGDALARWVDLESPEPVLIGRAERWAESRSRTPYLGVQREKGFPNLWYGVIPGTVHHDGGMVVVGSYVIIESEHVVRADNFGSLSLPV